MLKVIWKDNKVQSFESFDSLATFVGTKDKNNLICNPSKFGIKKIIIEDNNIPQKENNIILECLEKDFIIKAKLISFYVGMIEDIERLYVNGEIEDVGFVVPLLDVDGISITVMREILINTFNELRYFNVPITKKYIQIRWKQNGKNKIISNIPQKETNKTYWISFDTDFPFEVFGLKGSSFHNHYSLMKHNNPNSFNPNDILFKDDTPTKVKTHKRWKMGTSPLLLAFEGLFDLTEWKHHLLSMGDSSNEKIDFTNHPNYNTKRMNGRLMGLDVSSTENNPPLRFIGGMEFFYPTDEVYMFDNESRLIPNPTFNMDGELITYLNQHLPFGEKFVDWELDGELVILYKMEDFNPSTDTLLADTYCFKWVDKISNEEVFTHFINILRRD